VKKILFIFFLLFPIANLNSMKESTEKSIIESQTNKYIKIITAITDLALLPEAQFNKQCEENFFKELPLLADIADYMNDALIGIRKEDKESLYTIALPLLLERQNATKKNFKNSIRNYFIYTTNKIPISKHEVYYYADMFDALHSKPIKTTPGDHQELRLSKKDTLALTWALKKAKKYHCIYGDAYSIRQETNTLVHLIGINFTQASRREIIGLLQWVRAKAFKEKCGYDQ